MVRKIIRIDEDKCIGCGLCADACHEGAIKIIDGKAKLLKENFCDGFGDCLPSCPVGAIRFEEREAQEYDENAVLENKMRSQNNKETMCPEKNTMTINITSSGNENGKRANESMDRRSPSQLIQWPCQIKLVPERASFFDGAKLLIAADCTAYAYADLHNGFMKDKVTVIGCPKLDSIDYSEKLSEIIKNNDIKEVTILRMEVPCCGGIEYAAIQALKNSGKCIPWHVITIGIDGSIKDQRVKDQGLYYTASCKPR